MMVQGLDDTRLMNVFSDYATVPIRCKGIGLFLLKCIEISSRILNTIECLLIKIDNVSFLTILFTTKMTMTILPMMTMV